MAKKESLIHRYLSCERGMEVLKTCSLHLSNVECFNDPFELLPASKFAANAEKALYALNNAAQSKEGRKLLNDWGIDDFSSIDVAMSAGALSIAGPITGLAAAGILLWSKTKLKSEKQDQEIEEFNRYSFFMKTCYKEILQKLKVCCFSLDPTNIVMWGHYSKGSLNRKGKVIEINNAGIVLSFDRSSQYWNGELFQEVKYSDKRIALPTDQTNILTYAEELLSTKAKCWEYEKECRLIKLNAESDTSPFNSAALKAIRLGLNISNADKNAILRLRDRKYKDVPIFQAKRNDYEYKLDFVQL